ncbi:MAG: hypothetical protein AAGA37_23710 [Actinomycetota bacterium]
MKRTHLLAVFVVVLVAAACGSDRTTDERAAAIADVIKDDNEFPLTDDEAECTANNMVDSLDSETIDAIIADVDADIEDSEQTVIAMNALFDCIDLEALMIEQLTEDGTSEDEARCIVEAFGEDDIRSLVEMSALPDDQVDDAAAMAVVGEMMEIAGECGLG